MDILENIVYPQSPIHIQLLQYLLFLTLLILLPYISVLLGTTFFSYVHFRKGQQQGNREYLIFANELIDIFTVNKVMSITLGLVPVLSLMFIFGQLLLNSSLSVNSHILFILILFIAALISIYTYKYSFRLKNIFNLVNPEKIEENHLVKEFEGLKLSNSKTLQKSALFGFILLLVISYLLIGVLQTVSDGSKWIDGNSIFGIIFSTSTLLNFLFFISFSLTLTTAALIFKNFKSDSKEKTKNYSNLVKSFSLKTGLIFSSLQPLLFVVSILSSPKSALSFELFIVVLISLILMVVVSIFFYTMYKESKTNLGGSLVLILLIMMATIVYKDSIAFNTTNKKHLISLNKDYEKFVTVVKAKAGINEVVEINGEDIYNAKCIACHRFDSKLVGPAYNDVLPKYEDKRNELVDFILNPRKINPDFPAMPNQGVKPKEAEAIAEYIMTTYKTK
jgi:cytochrome c